MTKSKGVGILNLDNSKFKILTPKQIIQRLPIALAQVKAVDKSEMLLNEIREIIDSLYQAKQITKKVYNSIIKSIQQCTCKRWILYLWTQKTVKNLNRTF